MRRIVALSVFVVLLAGGCSSDKSSSPSASTGATTTGAGSAAASTGSSAATGSGSNTIATAPASADSGPVTIATAAGGPGGLAINPCGIVTAADVAAAFGGTVADGVINADGGGCDYDITGTTNTGPVEIVASINVTYGEGDYISATEEQKVFPDVVPVDGVGDAAWYYDAAHQLHVSVNGTELVISGLLPGDAAATQAEVIAFGKVVVGKLG